MQAWLEAAGEHCEQVHQQLVVQPRHLQQVQTDELRVKTQCGICWMVMAIMVTTRLWLGGVVGMSRDRRLIRQLSMLIQRCALLRPLLLAVGGLTAYESAFRLPACVSSQAAQWVAGAPRFRVWPSAHLPMVVRCLT